MQLDSSAFVAEQDLVTALRGRATPVDCSHDLQLFRQGEAPAGLHILHRGDVVMTMEDEHGRPVVTLPIEPGSLLGLPGLVGNAAYSMSAFARSGAEISFVSREEFSKLMLTEPLLGMMILRVLAAEVRTARMAMAGK